MKNKLKKMIKPTLLVIFILLCLYKSISSFIKSDPEPKPDGIYLNCVKIEEEITAKDMEDKYNMHHHYSSSGDTILIPDEFYNCTFTKNLIGFKSVHVTIINDTDDIISISNGKIKSIGFYDLSFSGNLIEIYRDGKCISLGSSKNDVIDILGLPINIGSITSDYKYDYYKQFTIGFNENWKVDNINVYIISEGGF